MMRRGGRGNNVQAPWRRRGDAIPSALYFERWLAARNYVRVTVLAACSIAISIIIWSSRPGRPSGLHLNGDNIQSRNPGFVFPLYHYYQQFPNSSDGGGGRERWRGSRVGNGRGIREESNPLFNVFGGHRLQDLEIQRFYIKMKLGVPPKEFHFHIDTGSGLTWVYCNVPSYVSNIANFGPHGMLVPEDDSYVKCTGETAALCRFLQNGVDQPCEEDINSHCLFVSHYADDSYFTGVIVNGSFTASIQDKSEMSVFSVFGCVVTKELKNSEQLPLITDGLIGLGNCEGTLMDQWFASKVINQNVLGVCLAKGMDWSMLPSPAAPVGYVSLGMDFKEKFDRGNSIWSKLTDPGSGVLCGYAANLLSISFDDRTWLLSSRFPHETGGIAMILDTGSDLTYLGADIYDPLLKTLDTYATIRGYIRVKDNDNYIESEQRLCWEPPATKLSRASPIRDFQPLSFAFEGIPSATEGDSLQFLVIQPVNYLTWEAPEKRLCVNILQDSTDGYSVSNLGAEVMREHLFVFDFENQRVRWQPSSCEL